MTDPTAPTPDEPDHADPDVELASAHLDGEVTPEERARVESDPSLRAHVEALAEVIDGVRDVPAPPPGLLDAHVDAALAELDAAGDGPDGGAPVVPLGRPRASRRRWQQLPLGAVAAVLVVVALVGAIGLASLGSDDGEDTATSALDAADDADAAGADESFRESGEARPEASTFDADAAEEGADGAAALPADRPEFASYEALVDELATRPTTSSGGDAASEEPTADVSPDEPARAAGDPCDAVSLLELDPADVETVLSATVAGDPVTAVLHGSDTGRRVAIVDDATCQLVLERDL